MRQVKACESFQCHFLIFSWFKIVFQKIVRIPGHLERLKYRIVNNARQPGRAPSNKVFGSELLRDCISSYFSEM